MILSYSRNLIYLMLIFQIMWAMTINYESLNMCPKMFRFFFLHSLSCIPITALKMIRTVYWQHLLQPGLPMTHWQVYITQCVHFFVCFRLQVVRKNRTDLGEFILCNKNFEHQEFPGFIKSIAQWSHQRLMLVLSCAVSSWF